MIDRRLHAASPCLSGGGVLAASQATRTGRGVTILSEKQDNIYVVKKNTARFEKFFFYVKENKHHLMFTNADIFIYFFYIIIANHNFNNG